MEQTAHTMLDLISGEVCGKASDTLCSPLPEEALSRLYRLSCSHDLAHLVGSALIRNQLLPDGAWRQKFEKQVMLAVYRCETQAHELACLRSTLEAAAIPFIPLKGSVLRRDYPEPWMRTSCDIDILVPEEQASRAAALLEQTLSYQKTSRTSHDIGMSTPSGVRLELHHSLIEKNLIGTAETILSSVWKYAAPLHDSFEYALSREMFYCYHIVHMAKHFCNGGCGIRPFLDLWILNHRVSPDRAECGRLLRQCGLSAFSEAAGQLSEVWFSSGAHTDVTREMEQFLLSGGAYGNTENRVAVQQVRRGGRFRYALSRIWIPYDALIYLYPSLEGRQPLTPLYEIRRWGRIVFCGGLRRSWYDLKLNASTPESAQQRTTALLRRLNLQ